MKKPTAALTVCDRPAGRNRVKYARIMTGQSSPSRIFFGHLYAVRVSNGLKIEKIRKLRIFILERKRSHVQTVRPFGRISQLFVYSCYVNYFF